MTLGTCGITSMLPTSEARRDPADWWCSLFYIHRREASPNRSWRRSTSNLYCIPKWYDLHTPIGSQILIVPVELESANGQTKLLILLSQSSSHPLVHQTMVWPRPKVGLNEQIGQCLLSVRCLSSKYPVVIGYRYLSVDDAAPVDLTLI
jgi:hypothetical protein